MSSLLNKLTGHKDSSKDSETQSSHQSVNQSNTAPYGASTGDSSTRTGAAYTNQSTAYTSSTDASNAGLFTQKQGISGDDAMTRSEEQLRIAKDRTDTGKAELNKYVTKEHVEQAVPVSRDRVVIEREPVNASNMDDAMKGPGISSAHYETTLREDRVHAEKETVPIERIRLAKQTEHEVQNVGADLRKEHVDFTHTTLAGDKVDNLGRNNTNINTSARKEAY